MSVQTEVVGKKRGRKPIDVTPADLQAAISLLEQSQPDGKFPNRSALWTAVEASEWAKSIKPRPLSGQTAMMLAKKNNLLFSTPVGQKGRQKGCGPVVQGARKSKMMEQSTRISLEMAVPEKFHPVVERAAKGSLKAKVKLKCLDCSGYQPKEVRLCTLTNCSLYTARPYRGKVQPEEQPDYGE